MPGSTNFQIFDANKVNIMDDVSYLVSDYRKDGVRPGIAPGDIHNKLYYQTSIFNAAFAQSLADRGLTVVDTVFADLVAVFGQIPLLSEIEALITTAANQNWKAGEDYAVGEVCYASSIANSFKRMECVIPGTTGTVEPAWTGVGTLVVDNGVTWIVDDVRDSTPVGRTSFEHRSAVRAGYVEANGALISRTAYSRLWAFAQNSGLLVTDAQWTGGMQGAFSTGDTSTTFRLPDLRGEFLRGFDNGRGLDTARVLGSLQLDDYKTHRHQLTGQIMVRASGSTYGTYIQEGPYDYTAYSGGTETRPHNIALLTCIKY